MLNFRRIFCGILVFLMFLAGNNVFAQSDGAEKILDFHSDVIVNKDASLVVVETIKVNALGEQIKHGIYRDFPTKYKDRAGANHSVSFEIISVQRDGSQEDYHTENISNGIRVYFGKADTLLDFGVHTYEFTYKTNRQVGFFSDHDELYWNVTGNGWVFPIDNASAVVTLPVGVQMKDMQLVGYTGIQNSRATNLTTKTDSAGKALFSTTEQLNQFEGLTVVVGWPKGFVQEPTKEERITQNIKDNIGIIVGYVGLLLILIYFVLAWFFVGRDPKKGTVIPQYESPDNLSPAAIHFVAHEGFNNVTFSAALLSMATKNWITIEEKEDKNYILNKRESEAILAEEEKSIYDVLFQNNVAMELVQENHTVIKKAMDSAKNSLKKNYGIYFKKNYFYFIIGVILSLFVASFIGILVIVIIDLVFYFLLPARTEEGRKLMDRIEGFKLFLSVTEKDRLNFHNPPGKTPELFEKFLPYALALKVEQKWAEQFTTLFAKMSEEGRGYVPAWYVGSYMANFNASSFSSHLGNSLPGIVSSSSSTPGSSSGFGGGGGGGGGW